MIRIWYLVSGISRLVAYSLWLVACGLWLMAYVPELQAGTFAYITNQGADNVSVLDTATGAKVATIPVGHRPAGIAVSRTDARAYVSNPESKEVSIIDRKSTRLNSSHIQKSRMPSSA